MRGFALGLIILTDIIIALTRNMDIHETSISFLLTLVIVIVVAFGSSALLRNIEKLKMTRNYIISGVIGIVLGILFFFWIKDNTAAVLNWLKQYGLLILLGINLLSALYIFFAKKPKKAVAAATVE